MGEFYFDQAAADRVINFIETCCCHSIGEFNGKPFTLLQWEKDFITPLFGWKRTANNLRRYREAGLWIPKKNGKSTLLSAISLYMAMYDNESGAECYIVATDQEQAGIIYREAANMIEASPLLLRAFGKPRRSKYEIRHEPSKSKIRALSSEKSSKHGINASFIAFEELGHWKSRELFDILKYASAMRRQPLHIALSTAGYDKSMIGYEQYLRAKRAMEHPDDDPYFLGMVFEADEKDDWTSLETAKKSNPSYGTVIPEDDFKESIRLAKTDVKIEMNYRCLRLNQWVGHVDAWISSTTWQGCAEPFDISILDRKPCHLGCDLAKKHDLASYVLWFKLNGLHYLLSRFYIPEKLIYSKEEQDHAPYSRWVKQGHIIATPGDTIDFAVIRQHILTDAKKYRLLECAYDPWGGELLFNQWLRIEDHMKVTEVRQGMATMSVAASEFEKLLKDKLIRHNNNPVLTWNAGNAVVRTDINLNFMPDKRNSTSRIDGITAACTACYIANKTDEWASFFKRGVVNPWKDDKSKSKA